MTGLRVERLRPSDRRLAEAFLLARRCDWGPGSTIAAWNGAALAGLGRLLDPNPGDGYHREHVRELVMTGDAAALAPVAAQAVLLAGASARVESRCVATDGPTLHALRAAGLRDEARLEQGWLSDAAPADILWLGRPAAAASRSSGMIMDHGDSLDAVGRGGRESRGRRSAGWPDVGASRSQTSTAARAVPCQATLTRTAEVPPRMGEGDLEAEAPRGGAVALTLRWVDDGLRPALAAFLAELVPGRSYPPGTLLSEAERLETQRRGALRAPWLVALDAEGEVAGGLVLERDPLPQRAHVRRLHLDVRPAWRGRGVGGSLVARARADAAAAGVMRLEADPRAGNRGAVGALRRGGFRQEGALRGAWRLRGPTGAWDEDVVLMSAPARP